MYGRWIYGLLFSAALMLTASTGYANGTGYLCQVRHIPGETSLGDHGYVRASVYDNPSCSTGYIRRIYMCSTGATHESCSSSTLVMDLSSVSAVAANWLKASIEGTQIYYNLTDSCQGAGTECLNSVDINYP